MIDEACCTCARLLSSISPQRHEKSGDSFTYNRNFECCGRFICGVCTTQNSRFASYCPFCQISTAPTCLPQGLHDPPPYFPSQFPEPLRVNPPLSNEDELPAYSSLECRTRGVTDKTGHLEEPAEDILHFLDPLQDTISSLSLRYGVPQYALRRTNSLFADHLLAARRTILIPEEFYKGGVSLSPHPINGEEEEIRKGRVRRWMVACKVAEIPIYLRYDLALLYLEQAGYELDAAVEAYLADEKWEKDHPIESFSRGKAKRKLTKKKFGINTGISGQL